jgi:hypothetical protein
MKLWASNQYHNQVGMFKRWYPIKHPCTWGLIFRMLLAWQVDEIIDRFENSISNLLQSFEIHYGYPFLALKCINYIPFLFLISWILYVQLIIERNGVQQHYLESNTAQDTHKNGYSNWRLPTSLSPSSTILSRCLCLRILDKFWPEKSLISTYSKDVSWKKMALSNPKNPNRQIFKNRFHYIAKCT